MSAVSHIPNIGDAGDAPRHERYVKKMLYTHHSSVPYDGNLSTHLSGRCICLIIPRLNFI